MSHSFTQSNHCKNESINAYSLHHAFKATRTSLRQAYASQYKHVRDKLNLAKGSLVTENVNKHAHKVHITSDHDHHQHAS